MHPPHMGLFQTLLFEIYFQSRRLFLGMDVIGSFTSRDVFVAAAPWCGHGVPSLSSFSLITYQYLVNRKRNEEPGDAFE